MTCLTEFVVTGADSVLYASSSVLRIQPSAAAAADESAKTDSSDTKSQSQTIEGNYCVTYGESDVRERIEIHRTVESPGASHSESFTFLGNERRESSY